MMVPVFFDTQRRKTKVWAFLGWRAVSVAVGYRVEPAILAIEARSAEAPPGQPPPVLFSGDHYEFAVPGGAFYLFPKVPRGTGAEFVAEAIKRNLLIIPGCVFSRRDTHVRISYAALSSRTPVSMCCAKTRRRTLPCSQRHVKVSA